MSLFIIMLSLLFAIAIVTFNESHSFDKSKMPVLKTVMALIIVLCHLAPRVDISWIQPLRYWGAPCVSVFFFVSGYGITKSDKSGLNYCIRRMLKVLIPFAIVSIMYFILVRIPAQRLNYPLADMVKTGTSPQHHLWFVWALLIEYSLFFLVAGIHKSSVRLFALFMLTVVVIAVLRTVGYDRCWYVSLLAFPMGSFVALADKWFPTLLNRSWISFSGCFGCSLLLAFIFYYTKIEWLYCVSHAFIALAVFSVVYHLPIEWISLKYKKIWGLSYEIYLTQMVAMDFLRGVLDVRSDVYYVILVLVFVVLLSLGLRVTQIKVFRILQMSDNG